MAQKTLLTVKIDKQLKARAQKMAKEMGLPLGTVVNAKIKQFIDQQQISFSVPLVPNKKTAALLKQATSDLRAGRNIDGPFTTIKEMDAYLDS